MTSNSVSDLSQQLRSGATLPPIESPHSDHAGLHGHVKPVTTKKKPANSNRFLTLNAFVDGSAQLVNTAAQACWYVLYRETKSATGTATISHRQLAEVMGVSRVTVMRAIKALEEAGLIRVLKRGGWRKGSSVYRVFGTPQPTPHPPSSRYQK